MFIYSAYIQAMSISMLCCTLDNVIMLTTIKKKYFIVFIAVGTLSRKL